MSDFQDNIDWKYTVIRLRSSCVGQPLNIQLIWMFEILSIVLFTLNTKSRYVVRLDKSYRLTHEHMVYLAATVGLQSSTIGYLSAYRNKFVHFGYLEAQTLLDKLLQNITEEDLKQLQKITGVTLDFDNRLL